MKDGNEIKLVEPSSNKVVKIANGNEITLVDNKGKKTKNSGKIAIRLLTPTFFEYSGNNICSKPITSAFMMAFLNSYQKNKQNRNTLT